MDVNGDVVARDLFNSGKNYCLTACTLIDYGIHFPAADLCAIVDDDRMLFHAAPLHALVLAHLIYASRPAVP